MTNEQGDRQVGYRDRVLNEFDTYTYTSSMDSISIHVAHPLSLIPILDQ